jgi:hypothetical protein
VSASTRLRIVSVIVRPSTMLTDKL